MWIIITKFGVLSIASVDDGCWPRKHPSSHGAFFLQWRRANWEHYISNWKTPLKNCWLCFHVGLFDKNYRLVMKNELIQYGAKSLPSFFYATHMSHENNLPTFHYTAWLTGILIMVYYNPYITGWYNHLYNATNQGFFHCSHIHTNTRPSGFANPKPILLPPTATIAHYLGTVPHWLKAQRWQC